MQAIILSLLYLLSFCIFIFTTFSDKYHKYRPLTKTITSIIFVLSYLILDASKPLMLIALILCMLGDFFLGIIKNDKKIFMIQGLVCFMMAHIIYIYLMCQDISFKLTDLIIPIIGLLFIYFISHKLKMDLKNKALPIYLYSFIVFFMGSKALYILLYSTHSGADVFAIGGILFLISDLILLFLYFKFKNNTKLQLANSILYYLAQYLMVISFLI